MTRNTLAVAFTAILAACSTTPMTTKPPSEAVAQLAPTGKLRAVINTGNPVLAKTGSAGGEPGGVSVDLARELAKRLGVPLETSVVNTAALSVEALKSKRVDVGFIAIDPVRAADMDFTAAYVLIEGASWCRRARRSAATRRSTAAACASAWVPAAPTIFSSRAN